MKFNISNIFKFKITIDAALHFVSYYYVILASINDGFSGITLGIPFAVFLVIDTIRNRSLYRYLNISALILSCVFYFSDRSTWTLIYPMVGSTLEVTENVFYIEQGSWISFVYHSAKEEPYYRTFEPGTKINVVNQNFDGNPDFGVAYLHLVDIEYKNKSARYSISGTSLSKLYHSQNMKFQKDRFQSDVAKILVFLPHMIFTYPAILFLFIISVIRRQKYALARSIMD